MRVVGRLQQGGASCRNFADNLPAQLVLCSRRHLANQRGNPVLPEAHLLFKHSQHDDGIAGRPNRSMFHRVRQFLNGSRIVPQTRRGALGHLMQRALVRDGCHAYLWHEFPPTRTSEASHELGLRRAGRRQCMASPLSRIFRLRSRFQPHAAHAFL